MTHQYAKAMQKHPNLNVRNVERLIERIGESVSWRKGRAMVDGELRPDRTCKEIAEADMRGGRNPLDFGMHVVAGHYDRRRNGDIALCGTAACIAGFARALRVEDRMGFLGFLIKPKVTLDRIKNRSWMGLFCDNNSDLLLAKFIGVKPRVASRMFLCECSDPNHIVEPRHAVKLLQKFLKTGKVDWKHAMGRKKNGNLTKAEERLRRAEEKERREIASGLNGREAA